MNKQFSIYLDFIRFLAAVSVFLSHAPDFAGGWGWQLAGFGHEAVVVFFVLSGFVISYVVDEKKEDAFQYTISRLARIYSVALPALLLTVCLYYIGMNINPDGFIDLFDKLQNPIWTFFSALFFVNQSWIASPVFSNLPYWSLGYEVLYYIFFGFWVFSQGKRRVIFIALVLCVMGPSILLYLPIWLAGRWCFKLSKTYKWSMFLAVVVYIVSILGVIIFSQDTIQHSINEFGVKCLGMNFYQWLLEPAEQFLSDYVLTIFIILHLLAAYQLSQNIRVFGQLLGKAIQNMSAHTFSLYLFHMPMLYFISAVIPYKNNPIINIVLVWILVPSLIFLLSLYTENKKLAYKKFFNRVLYRFFNKLLFNK